jgi:monoamine oxidase
MRLSRREFVASAAAGLLAARSNLFAQSRRRIVVLGAGLSGLSAAYDLAQKGFDVTVIEARERIGGRIQTLRKPFRDGQHIELGGELLGDGYKRFLGYADKFGIKYEVVPSEIATGGSVADLQKRISSSAIIGGKLYPAGSVLDANPYILPANEASELPPTQLIKHIVAMAGEVRTDPSKLALFDVMSLAEALRKRGVSSEMIRLMNISLNYNSIETVSAGGILWESRRRISAGTKAVRVIGGNDQITTALFENAKKLGVRFILDAKVEIISYPTQTAKVSYSKGGRYETVKCDRIVCTIPYSVLGRVNFVPGLPETKMNAIRGLGYTRITKVFLHADRTAWDNRNLGSSVWTDMPCERIFNAAGKKGDNRGIFTLWTEGEGATVPDKLDDNSRIAWGKHELSKAMPFMKKGLETGFTKSWANDEFARGAYSHFTIGGLKTIQPHLKTSVGPIHFAGEHTAENAPGMEGALESAERIVKEISEK